MSRIKSRDTKPEMIVRRYLHKKGLRYRLNGKLSASKINGGYLPGKPDLVFSKYQTVLFVNGCFWHLHKNCKKSHLPKTNTNYWEAKLNRNRERDIINYKKLHEMGYKVVIIWECEILDQKKLEQIYREIISD